MKESILYRFYQAFNIHHLYALTGCVPCECNGHGDKTDGYCNSTDGKCYCQDNTEGDHCELCKSGYYGDPRDENKCYLKCDGRTILGNITSGALGSHAGDGVKNTAHAYCLWILTIHSDLTNLRLLDHVPTITFSMEVDIKTFCSRVSLAENVYKCRILNAKFETESAAAGGGTERKWTA